jgi:hypothetical protein
VLVGVAAFLASAGCGALPAPSTVQELTAAEALSTPVRGDVNGDGVVDQADLDLMTAAFGSRQGDPLFVPEAELDGDGVIGLEDLQALVQILDAQGSAGGS